MQELLSKDGTIYAYADEATFYRDEEEYVGVGIFLTDTPIGIEMIQDALILLKADKELLPKQDGRTLSGGYFHACEDSKNAHSYICRAICEKLNGFFSYAYIKKGPESKRSYEMLYRLTTQLLMGRFLDDGYRVVMHCEQRNGFSQFLMERFIEGYFSQIDYIAVEHPSIINRYPSISIKVAGKTEPGIQVCDFMLWANNREMMLPSEPTWKNRLKMSMLKKGYYKDLSQFSGEYGLGKFSWGMETNGLVSYPYLIPHDPPDPDATLTDYYAHIERTIISLKQHLPTHVAHLEALVDKAHRFIIAQEFTESSIRLIAKAYIRLFDSIPLYGYLKDQQQEEWNNLLFAKRLAGLLIGTGKIHYNRTRNHILRFCWTRLEV